MRRRRDTSAGLLDMMATGLGGDDLGVLTDLRAVGATDPDAAPGLPEHPVVRAGDVWSLGDHRLACGDSTDPVTVRTLLGADRPHLMVTDPPYGVEYSPDWRNRVFRADGTPIGGRAVGTVRNDSVVDWSAAWRLFPGDVAYVWHADRYASEVQRSLESASFVIRSQIVWNKSRFVIGRGDYHWKHEPCWYCVRKGATARWSGGRSQTTVWDIAHVASDSGHGTQKPVECMLRPIENNSEPGDSVYEPFSGSGTTIIAAEMSRRRCLAVELNPLYVYVAISRWQNFVGRSATLLRTGETFAEVLRRRLADPSSDPEPDRPTAPSPEPPRPDPTDDAVLCQALCERYCPPGGSVLETHPDPARRALVADMRLRETDGAADMVLHWPPPDVDPGTIGDAPAALAEGRRAVAVVDGMDAAFRAVAAFRAAGLHLVDDAVHVRTDPSPVPGRLARAHLNVLVFVKGESTDGK